MGVVVWRWVAVLDGADVQTRSGEADVHEVRRRAAVRFTG